MLRPPMSALLPFRSERAAYVTDVKTAVQKEIEMYTILEDVQVVFSFMNVFKPLQDFTASYKFEIIICFR